MKKERIVWLDWARAFAILCVILVHVTEGIFPFHPEGMATYSLVQQAILFSCFTLGRIGVPLFLFLTGYLLLPRDYSEGATKAFWKNRLLGLLITTEIWIVLMELFWSAISGTALDPFSILRKMCFLGASSISHMWYMPMILGMYCFLPLISNGIRRFDWKTLLFPLSVVLVYVSLLPSLGTFLQAYGVGVLPEPVIDLSFGGGTFGVMIILGYCLSCGLLRRWSKWLLLWGCVFSFAFTVVSQIFLYRHGIRYNVWYNYFPLIIAAACLFELASRVRLSPSGLVTQLATYSFGIYLVHSPIRILLIRCLPTANPFVKLLIVYVGTLLFSFLFVFVCSRVRLIKKLLFAA